MYILIRLADRAQRGGDDVTAHSLSRELYVPETEIQRIVDGLKEGGFVIEADPTKGSLSQGLFLTREPSAIVLADAINSVDFDRGARDGEPRVDRVLQKMHAVRNELLKTLTLDDIRSPENKTAEQGVTKVEANT
jgi:DNA-binding IscR family transcriptional regulator